MEAENFSFKIMTVGRGSLLILGTVSRALREVISNSPVVIVVKRATTMAEGLELKLQKEQSHDDCWCTRG